MTGYRYHSKIDAHSFSMHFANFQSSLWCYCVSAGPEFTFGRKRALGFGFRGHFGILNLAFLGIQLVPEYDFGENSARFNLRLSYSAGQVVPIDFMIKSIREERKKDKNE